VENRCIPRRLRTYNYTVLKRDLRWRLRRKKPLI
jgi:hypothetical protein